MEWIAAVWNKINKPLHFLFVGAALILFAPPEFKWAGYIFLAFGLARSVEWGTSQFNKWWAERKELEKIRQSIGTLNKEEKSLLQMQVHKGEQTFYMDPFSVGSIPKFLKLHSLCQGLADKRILDVSETPDGKVKTLHITAAAWKLLDKAFNHAGNK
jgi:hypothetical protein